MGQASCSSQWNPVPIYSPTAMPNYYKENSVCNLTWKVTATNNLLPHQHFIIIMYNFLCTAIFHILEIVIFTSTHFIKICCKWEMFRPSNFTGSQHEILLTQKVCLCSPFTKFNQQVCSTNPIILTVFFDWQLFSANKNSYSVFHSHLWEMIEV